MSRISCARLGLGVRGYIDPDATSTRKRDESSKLLPLDSRRWFSRDVVHDAGDTGHLIDDAKRDVGEEFVGEFGPVGCHEVDRFDGAQGDDVIVTATVAHDSDGADGKENGESLTRAVVEIVFAELFDEDGVCAAEEVCVFFADLAEDADAEAGAREGVAVNHLAGQAEFDAEAADLVFEKLA